MLIHHGSGDYQTAASAAAASAKNKLLGIIEEGRNSAKWLLEKVQNEVPEDRIIPTSSIEIDGDVASRGPDSSNEMQLLSDGGLCHDIEDHALAQMCGRTDGKTSGLPWRYAQWLRHPEREAWGKPLLAQSLNEIFWHQKKKYLVRSYDKHVRGFLSDSYRRLDSRPLLEAFATTAQKFDAVPIRGYGNATKVAMKAILPQVFEPADNEVIAFGAMWENSDYGNGKLKICGFMMRLWCTNYAISESGFSQVHLGKKLSDNISFSQKTYELDTMTSASAIEDVVSNVLSADTVNAYCEVIKTASKEEIDPQRAITKISALLSKTETEQLTNVYNTGGIELLPPGNTTWRLSNAVSWVAGQTDEMERKLDLMKLAGKVVIP